jgi:tetratricopeptide (TPR) repeat protein
VTPDRHRGRPLAVAVLLAALPVRAQAESALSLTVVTPPVGSPRAEEALALCDRADRAAAADRAALLARGLALAEEAVAAEDTDARAHFAVFCNLGRRMALDGLGLRSLVSLRRLRREIDRTLELAPDYPPALVGKGSLLADTPWVLGGAPAEGEKLLRRAVAIDPDDVDARLHLARALAVNGATDEAHAEAERALGLAMRAQDASSVAEARTLLGKLGK